MRMVLFLLLLLASCGETVYEQDDTQDIEQVRSSKGSGPLSVQHEIEEHAGASTINLKFQAKSNLRNITFKCDQKQTKHLELKQKRWFIEQIDPGQTEVIEFEIKQPFLDERLLIRIDYETREKQLSLTVPITLVPTGFDKRLKSGAKDENKSRDTSGLTPASKPRN